MTDGNASSRRDFLTGRSLGSEINHVAHAVGDAVLDGAGEPPAGPRSGPTVRISTRAMACDFQVILNAGPDSAVETWHASDALDLVHRLEDQMTVYRDHSELITINRTAAVEPVEVEPRLFDLLRQACELSRATEGAFDPTSQPLVALWRRCRDESRTPDDDELRQALALVGTNHLNLDADRHTIEFARPGVELNVNGIGKGHALDRAAEVLDGHGLRNWLLHGGHSSVLARGDHNGQSGWPVGIRNPLFPDQRLATLVLRDRAMGTSGSGVQFFRVEGRRFGHILDPRSGWPVDHLLSATVLAPTAAEADALATAFFVLGLEKASAFCQNYGSVSALLIPPPRGGRKLEPVCLGIPDDDLFFPPDSTTSEAGIHA